MSPADTSLEHPVVAGLRGLSAGLHAVVAADQVWQLSDQQVETALATVFEVQANTAVLQGMLLGEADQRDLKSYTGAPNLVRWLGDRFRLSRPDAATRVRQAGDLLRHRPVRDALTAGAVTVEQATTAAVALDQVAALPGLTDQDRTSAATFLLQQCAALTPPELARAGQAVVEALTRTPSQDDPAAAAALARDQQRAEADAQAAERNDLRVTRRRGRLRAVLDLGTLGEATLHAWLRRVDSPTAGDHGLRDQRLPSERRGDAIVELLAAATGPAPHGAGNVGGAAYVDGGDGDAGDGGSLTDPLDDHDPAGEQTPPSGSVAPLALLTITTTATGLRDALPAAGVLDTGGTLSAAALRQLACDALVLPAVLGGASQVLDLGRSTRVWNRAQRRAAALRDRGCTAPGCDRPPAACQLHHARHWIDGGPTDLTNAALLCGFHHRMVHRQGWTVTLAPNGYPQLEPPPSIDPDRRPRQHHRYAVTQLTQRHRD